MGKFFGIFFALCLFSGTALCAEPIGRTILSDLLEANKSGRSDDLRGKYQTTGPIAVVLYCSDSGEDPNTLFSQDKDQLAIVRTAGNTISIAGTSADSVEIGSIEYAVHYQGISLIIVMGHTNCVVVDTVLGLAISDTNAPAGNMDSVFQVIRPAITRAMIFREAHKERLRVAVNENVKNMVLRLKRSRYMLGKREEAGQLTIVGCVYDTDKGLIEIVDTK